jgi:hypothetical protein
LPRRSQDAHRYRARSAGHRAGKLKGSILGTADVVDALEQEKTIIKAGQVAERILPSLS